MAPTPAGPLKTNKYVPSTHHTCPDAPVSGLLKPARTSPKQLRGRTAASESKAQQKKRTKSRRQTNNEKRFLDLVSRENDIINIGRPNQNENTAISQPGVERSLARPKSAQGNGTAVPYRATNNSNGASLAASKQLPRAGSDGNRSSVGGHCSEAVDRVGEDVQHLFTFSSSSRKPIAKQEIKPEPVDLPSPLTKRFGSIALDEPQDGPMPATVSENDLRDTTPQIYRDLRLFEALEEGGRGSGAGNNQSGEQTAAQFMQSSVHLSSGQASPTGVLSVQTPQSTLFLGKSLSSPKRSAAPAPAPAVAAETEPCATKQSYFQSFQTTGNVPATKLRVQLPTDPPNLLEIAVSAQLVPPFLGSLVGSKGKTPASAPNGRLSSIIDHHADPSPRPSIKLSDGRTLPCTTRTLNAALSFPVAAVKRPRSIMQESETIALPSSRSPALNDRSAFQNLPSTRTTTQSLAVPTRSRDVQKPANKSKSSVTLECMPVESKSGLLPGPLLSPFIRDVTVESNGCDVINPSDDGTTSHPRLSASGKSPPSSFQRPSTKAVTQRRRQQTPAVRRAPKSTITPARIKNFNKAETNVAKRKKTGMQRRARIFKQKIKVDGLTEDRLELFWTTLGELKTAGKLFQGNRIVNPKGELSRYDGFDDCVQAVNRKIGRGHKRFGKKEGGAAMYELQNQRMLAIAGVNNTRVFLTRDAQAALGT